jgi:hypothetical protein
LKFAPELYRASRQIPKIAKETGHLITNRNDNKKWNNQYLRDHEKAPIHTEVITILKRRKRDSMPQLLLQM